MRAVIEVGEDHTIILKEVYSGIRLETRDGNAIGVCMRDDTLEIRVIPKGCTDHANWWRVNMQAGTIEKMGAGPRIWENNPADVGTAPPPPPKTPNSRDRVRPRLLRDDLPAPDPDDVESTDG